jgi:hypothetical protein
VLRIVYGVLVPIVVISSMFRPVDARAFAAVV